MLKRRMVLATFVLVFGLPISVNAQQNAQNGGGLQSPSSNAQNTRNLQTPVSPAQGSNSNILESQPDSLGVVGSPSQQQPSVVVGQSTSKTSVDENDEKKSGIWSTVLILAILVFVFWVVYKKINRINAKTETFTEPEIIIETIDPKIQSKNAKASASKTSKKPPTGQHKKKKSKKKRNHR